MTRCFIIFGLIFLCLSGFSQGEIDNEERIFFRNEKTYGLLVNTNGLGFNFRYGKRIDAYKKTLYEIEINHLKHPKEKRSTHPYYGTKINFGKLNTVYTLKGGIGYQNEIYRKRDVGGISIRNYINVGPSFALMKPVYFMYNGTVEIESRKYDGSTIEDTRGMDSFFKGIDELKVSPGIYLKYGYTFEFSRADEIFQAIELGAGIDAYLLEVPILSAPPQKTLFIFPDNHFFITLYCSYRFGKVIDTKYQLRRNKIDRLITE